MSVSISGLDALRRKLLQITDGQALTVSAGVRENAKNKETGELVAPYAALNEFGGVSDFHGKTIKIPSRPFMRSTFETKQSEWVEGLRRLLAAGHSVEDALDLTGLKMKQDIQTTIKSNMPPPNSPETLKYKNRDMGTLMQTGSLHQSIKYRVGSGPWQGD